MPEDRAGHPFGQPYYRGTVSQPLPVGVRVLHPVSDHKFNMGESFDETYPEMNTPRSLLRGIKPIRN